MADTYCLRRRTRSAGRAGPFGLGHPPGRKVVLGCLLFLVVPSASVGDIQVGLDLPAMCERADLVVVGRAVEVRPDGRATFADEGASYPGRLVVVTLDVERLLRGTAGRTLNFTFTVPAVPVIDVGGRAVQVGEIGVFFLRRDAQGYAVLDQDYPDVPAWPGRLEAAGSMLDRVTAEVVHALNSPGAPAGVKLHAIRTLAMIRTPAATAALKGAVTSPSPDVRLAAASALITQSHASVLRDVEPVLLSNSSKIDPQLRDSVGRAIGFGIKDPRAIPLLIPLLASHNVYLRRGAAAALRNTHDPRALGPLSQALYDSDREVRYYAVVGLGELTRQNQWTPSIANFDQNEQKFLKHWRDWAKSLKRVPHAQGQAATPPASRPAAPPR